jgi:hypothetical protein
MTLATFAHFSTFAPGIAPQVALAIDPRSSASCSFREVCAIVGLDEDATRARLLALARGAPHARG